MAQPSIWGNALQDAFANPMTLGGLSLLSGGDLNSGIRSGAALQQQVQQQRQRDATQESLKGMFADPNSQFSKLDAGSRSLLESNPDMAADVFMKRLSQQMDPMAGLDADYKRAQIDKLRREAAGGGETPSNIREWQAFQRMTPDQQRQYLTMKRADRFYNTGTDFVSPDTVNPSGPPRASIPINNADKASATKFGEKRGDVAFSLPQFEYNAKKLISALDGVLTDPYLPKMIGPVAGRLPNFSGAANRVQTKMDQIQAKSFLQAYDDMRGAGAISDAEGAKAEKSKNRLQNATQGTQDWIDAANEFRQDVFDLIDLKRRQASGTYQPPQVQAQPQAPAAAAPSAPGGWSVKRID